MNRNTKRSFVGLFLFLTTLSTSFLTTAEDYSNASKNKVEIKKYAPWVDLAKIDEVTASAIDNVSNAIGVEPVALEKMTITRVYTADLYQVNLDGKSYIVNASADYWISADAIGNVFLFNNNITPVNASNEVREDLIKLTQLASRWQYPTAVFEESNATETIYAFVDLSCPHCKNFHLTKRESWQHRGVRFVYLPMLLDQSVKRVRQLHERVFCLPSNKTKNELITHIYLNGTRVELPEIENIECSKADKALFDSLMNAGGRYGLSGTPLFLTESGNLLYGINSLEQYLRSQLNKKHLPTSTQ